MLPLATLPDELLRAVLTFATHEELKHVRATCKRLATVVMAPPYHTRWRTMLFDSLACSWTQCVTRSVQTKLNTNLVRTLIPEVLFYAGARLTKLQLGHRMYPQPSQFGNAELAVVARACPLLTVLKVYYRDVSFSRTGLQHLLSSCLMLTSLAMPFGSPTLRAQLRRIARDGGSGAGPWTLQHSAVQTLRLHNLSLGYISDNFGYSGRVPAMFARSLTALKLVNVCNLDSLSFLVHLPFLRHFTMKHCSRAKVGSVTHAPVSNDAWYRFLAPRLLTLCVVDVDHVVCESRVVQALFTASTAFAQLRELRMDGELFVTLPMSTTVSVERLLCPSRCRVTAHRFHTWECVERCGECIRTGPAHLVKLQKLYFYNDSFYKLYNTVA
jgi:hypothetical protein